MAGSRIHKVGDIFTRTTGLIRAGAVKKEDRPLWYDVYEAFPPLQAPTFGRPKPASLTVKQIFYPEDVIRAKFYRKYGSPGTINLDESRSSKHPSICESFVAAYQEIESKQQGLSPDQLMMEAEVALEKRGVYPNRTRRPRALAAVTQAPEESVEEILETQSEITSAVLPSDVLKKIFSKDLTASSQSGTSSSDIGTTSPDNTTSISAASDVSPEAIKKEADDHSSSSNASSKEENKDGSGT